MAFHYATKPDLQAGYNRYTPVRNCKYTNRPRCGIDTCRDTKYQLHHKRTSCQSETDFGDVCDAQKTFFERYATVLSTDIQQNIVKYKENVRNAVDEHLALYGIMDTSRDYPDEEPSVRRPERRRSTNFIEKDASPLLRQSCRRSVRDAGKLRSENLNVSNYHLNVSDKYSSSEIKVKEKRRDTSGIHTNGGLTSRLSNRNLSSRSRSHDYSRRTSGFNRGSASCSSSDSGLDAGGYISDSDSASIKSMKSGVTCAIIQKQSYDKKMHKTKSTVSLITHFLYVDLYRDNEIHSVITTHGKRGNFHVHFSRQ